MTTHPTPRCQSLTPIDHGTWLRCPNPATTTIRLPARLAVCETCRRDWQAGRRGMTWTLTPEPYEQEAA